MVCRITFSDDIVVISHSKLRKENGLILIERMSVNAKSFLVISLDE